MVEPPEFWVFALTNLIVFGFGSVLAVLSFIAYRSNPTSTSFRNAALGFGFITIGGLVEPFYQLAIRGDYHLTGREILAMQGMEGILMAIGFGMLFYSIKGYNQTKRITGRTVSADTNNSP